MRWKPSGREDAETILPHNAVALSVDALCAVPPPGGMVVALIRLMTGRKLLCGGERDD
jgi:hypothetical protein